jgi:hypothetical protein
LDRDNDIVFDKEKEWGPSHDWTDKQWNEVEREVGKAKKDSPARTKPVVVRRSKPGKKLATLEEREDHWIREIQTAIEEGEASHVANVGSTIQLCKQLADMCDDLPEGSQTRVLHQIGLHERKARRLASIGRNEALLDRTTWSALPASYRALADLAPIPAKKLYVLVKKEKVHADLTVAESTTLRIKALAIRPGKVKGALAGKTDIEEAKRMLYRRENAKRREQGRRPISWEDFSPEDQVTMSLDVMGDALKSTDDDFRSQALVRIEELLETRFNVTPIKRRRRARA